MPGLDGPLYRSGWPHSMQAALYHIRKKRRLRPVTAEGIFTFLTDLIPSVIFQGELDSIDGLISLNPIGGVLVSQDIIVSDQWDLNSPLIKKAWEFDRTTASGLLYPDVVTMDPNTSTYWAMFLGYRATDLLNSLDVITGKRDDLDPLFPGMEICVSLDPDDLLLRTEEETTGTRVDAGLTSGYEDIDPHTLGILFDPLDTGTFSFATESEFSTATLNNCTNSAPLHFGRNRKASASMRIAWVVIVTGPQLSGYTGVDLMADCNLLQIETT